MPIRANQPSLPARVAVWISTLVSIVLMQSVHAQAVCQGSSVKGPQALHERFISADCESCWQSAHAASGELPGLSLDWIVPSPKGDNAPLSAAESSQALDRLQHTGAKPVLTQVQVDTPVHRNANLDLSISFGVAVGPYRGITIDLAVQQDKLPWPRLDLWVLMIERLSAGAEGSPIERRLVRNVLQQTWGQPNFQKKDGAWHAAELRAMSMPEGMQPDRTELVAWLQTPQGQVIGLAHASCPTNP